MSYQYHQYHSTVSIDLCMLKRKPADLSMSLEAILTILLTLKTKINSFFFSKTNFPNYTDELYRLGGIQ